MLQKDYCSIKKNWEEKLCKHYVNQKNNSKYFLLKTKHHTFSPQIEFEVP